MERELLYNESVMWLFPDTGSNLPPNDYKSNTKPLSYKANDENSRSNSLFTFKCELLFQMTEQSYSFLFTLIIGFIPMSIKRLTCYFIINLCLYSEKLAQVISAVQGLFSNYLKQHDEKTLFLQTALLKFI